MRGLIARLLPVLVALVLVVALVWVLAGQVDDPRLERPGAPGTEAPR